MSVRASISNRDFVIYLRQYLAGIEGTLTHEQAAHISTLCSLVRSFTNWIGGICGSRIVEIDLLTNYVLAGYDPETMTAEIRASFANVRWGEDWGPGEIGIVCREVAAKIAEFDRAASGAAWDVQQAIRRDTSLRLRASVQARKRPTVGAATMLPASLRLVAVNRKLVEDPDFRVTRTDTPPETLVVRDDLGRKLDVAAVAWGPVAGALELFPERDADSGYDDVCYDDIVVSKAPLTIGKTYLVVVVEHPDALDTED